MNRREFITLLGGAAVGWPFAASAQQAALPVVGFLHLGSCDTFAYVAEAFRQGLRQGGYVEGQNVAIDYCWADGHPDRLPALAAGLVQRQVAVIAALGGSLPALAAKTVTTTIPIVFGTPEDPVRIGLVESLGRPGGNATGVNFFTAELVAKRLGLLRELLPKATRVAALVNPDNAALMQSTMQELEAAARSMGLRIQVLKASSGGEINRAFATLARERPDALFVGPGFLFNSRRVQLVHLATLHKIPAAYS